MKVKVILNGRVAAQGQGFTEPELRYALRQIDGQLMAVEGNVAVVAERDNVTTLYRIRRGQRGLLHRIA